MNYEEKYKEALKIIESLYNVVRYQSSLDALLVSQTIEKAFPELHESEDERIRKTVLKMITDMDGGYPFEKYGIIKKDAIAWLEKQGEQEPVEWSEEDEDVINHLIAICAGAKRYRQFAGCLQDDITKYQTWLKSIKPNHWKPSEEQMEALKKRTHGLHTSSETRKALESLINDLEKLRLC